ncbi:hypothetical protein PIB30_050962 [Stylosanthes scabra]|uniref:Uncharacterized protein n=1 Tax=Stylosanthes scabra TaxID=79078 RepID=A0ABU6XIA0_9FABA|nr:hypothetical protein [Stylosanthes scabra]
MLIYRTKANGINTSHRTKSETAIKRRQSEKSGAELTEARHGSQNSGVEAQTLGSPNNGVAAVNSNGGGATQLGNGGWGFNNSLKLQLMETELNEGELGKARSTAAAAQRPRGSSVAVATTAVTHDSGTTSYHHRVLHSLSSKASFGTPRLAAATKLLLTAVVTAGSHGQTNHRHGSPSLNTSLSSCINP